MRALTSSSGNVYERQPGGVSHFSRHARLSRCPLRVSKLAALILCPPRFASATDQMILHPSHAQRRRAFLPLAEPASSRRRWSNSHNLHRRQTAKPVPHIMKGAKKLFFKEPALTPPSGWWAGSSRSCRRCRRRWPGQYRSLPVSGRQTRCRLPWFQWFGE